MEKESEGINNRQANITHLRDFLEMDTEESVEKTGKQDFFKMQNSSKNEEESGKNLYTMKIVWTNVFIMTLLHIAGFYGFYLRYTESKFATIVFAKAFYTFSGFGVTAGAHRLWSHRCYKANWIAQTVLMLLNSGTYQNSIFTWSRDHRLHHKYTDTDADPHNSNRGFFFSHMGWLLVRKHPEVRDKGKNIDMSDLRANEIVMFQHRNYYLLVATFGILIPTLIPWYFWNESLKSSLFVATFYRYILSMHMTWSINSFAHLHGYKPYEKNMRPSENFIPMYTTGGEGFHNYHHTFPWDYKASELGFDPRNSTTMVINTFARLGWATDLKTVPKELIEKRANKTGDGSYRKPEEDIIKKTLSHVKNFAIYFAVVCIV